MSDLLSTASLQRFEELKSDFHASLGNELLEKVRNALEDFKDDRIFADKGILWWILHNQLEVIGRMEVCKRLLREVGNLLVKSKADVKDRLATLDVALDHLKQNLTFLVGEIQVTSEGIHQSFYELDSALNSYAMKGEEAAKYYHVLIEQTATFEDAELRRTLERLKQTLQDQQQEKRLINKTVEAVSEMLVAADFYYAEVAAFSDSEPQAMLLLYHFRKVEAAGMHLLCRVMLAETMISTVYYIM